MSSNSKFIHYLTALAVFLLPLVFFPFISTASDLNKLIPLIIFALVLLITGTVTAIVEGKIKITLSPLTLSFLFFLLTQAASLFFATPNRHEAFISELLPLIVVFIYYLVFMGLPPASPSSRWHTLLSRAIIASAGLLSVFSLVQVFSGQLLPSAFGRSALFSPAGSPLTHLLIIALGISALSIFVREHLKDLAGGASGRDLDSAQSGKLVTGPVSQYLKLPLTGFLLVLLAAGLYYSFQNIATAKGLVTPLDASWSVALESLKRSPFLGSGIGNYRNSYTRFRPLSTNSDSLIDFRFAASHNSILHYATNSGLVGLAAYLLFLSQIIIPVAHSLTREKKLNPLTLLSLVTLVGHLFIPLGTLPLFFLLLFVCYLDTNHHRPLWDRSEPANLNWLQQILKSEDLPTSIPPSIELALKPKYYALKSVFLSIGIFLFTAYSLYYSFTLLSTQYRYQKSLNLLQSSKVREAYDETSRLIKVDPSIDAYHLLAANESLVIAQSLAGKGNLTDDERKTFSSLISQAVSQAKIATSLNPQRSVNWDTLANIYTRIIPISSDAAQFALNSLTQAIQMDPLNPYLYFNLGSLQANFQQYSQAQLAFSRSAGLKPNFANSHYNLAFMLEKQGDLVGSAREMQLVVNLLPPNSPESATAQKALDALSARLKNAVEKTASGSGSLSLPSPIPTRAKSAPGVVLPATSPALSPTPILTPTPLK